MLKKPFILHRKRTFLIIALMIFFTLPVAAENITLSKAYDPLPIDLSHGYEPDSSKFFPDGKGYQDDSIYIRIYESRAFDTDLLYAHIKVSHPSQIRTAPANTFKSKGNQLASTIAKRYHAVAAINGDYFQFNSERFIIRQGQLIRNRPTGEDLLLIDSEGDFHTIRHALSDDIIAKIQKIENTGRSVNNAFSFGPILVENDKSVFPADTGYFNTAPLKYAQRAVIAQLGPLEYLILSTEGPEDPGSKGLLLHQAAESILEAAKALNMPCLVAYNLDGGSSNSLILGGNKVNSPNNPKKRPVSDIIYFATLVP